MFDLGLAYLKQDLQKGFFMKNGDKKQKFKENLTEALLELLLGAVLLIIGFAVASLFGADMPLFETDPEIFVLIGIGFIAFIFFALYIIRRSVNKKRTTKYSEDFGTGEECSTDEECGTDEDNKE